MRYNPIIVAMDLDDGESALALARKLTPLVGGFKIGARLFTAEGPTLIKEFKKLGKVVFLDLKYHDIPNTVAGAVTAAARLGVDMLTVHAVGGREMLKAAEQAAQNAARELNVVPPLVLAVTVLTSLNDKLLEEVGVSDTTSQQVVRLARLAVGCGLRGLVCSPEELKILRDLLPREIKLVTPGIRAVGMNDDQKRTLDAKTALDLGADWIVVGRPIYAAPDPVEATKQLLSTIF